MQAILKANIDGKNTAVATATLAMPILRYVFGILCWIQVEIRRIDQKKRKIMTKYKYHHLKFNTNHIYISRKLGRRGITSATDCFQQECTGFANYLVDNTINSLIEIVKKSEGSIKRGFMAFSNELTLQEIKKLMQDERSEKMTQMPLHWQ